MMQKITYLKSLLLLCALIVGSGTSWAAELSVDITPDDALNNGGVDPINIVCAKGDGSSNPAISSGQLRLYQAGSGKTTGNTITFSSDYNIKKIEFTFANSMTADNGEFSSGTYDSGTSTWTGSTTSVTLTVTGTTSGKRIYITAMTVYYEAAVAVDPNITITATTIAVGGQAEIEGPADLTLSFTSDKTSVATVSAEGVVKGVAAGTAKITATWEAVADKYNAGSAVFDVTVVDATIYEKVTNASQLVAGNEYILVATESNVAMGAVNSGNNKIRDYVDVTVTDDEVEITGDAVAVLTLGGSTGAWTFLASDNSEYLALTSNSNEIHSSDDATANTAKWVVTEDFQLQSKAQSDTRYVRYNSSNPRFACYKSGQQTAVLFVKSGSAIDAKADPELSYATTSCTVSFDEASTFVAPTLTNPHSLTVTYSSSDENLAVVDENTGEVVLSNDTEGTVTITASFVGDETYKAGSASYTITIYDPNVKGSIGNPYTVAEVIDGTATGTAYVKGYITGFVKSINDPIQTIDITKDTNFALSDTEGDTDIDNNIAVQLQSGDLRTAWNLKNNDRIGVEVLVKGSIEEYFKPKMGVKTPTEIIAVSVPATVSDAGYATWVAPFNVEVPSGVEAYYVSNADVKATLSEVMTIPANEPVVLKNKGSYRLSVIDAGDLDAPTFGNLLKCDGNIASGDYVLAKHSGTVGFYKWTGSAELPTNQVYLPAEAAAAEYDFISIEGDGISTGIDTVDHGQLTMDNGEVYNLNGQRVAQPTKGLYIVNGKKYVIK